MKPFEKLTHLGQIRRLRTVARASLDAYGLPNARLKFIARSENTTFRVDMPVPVQAADDAYVAGRYVLRVHRPAHQTLESLTSEMQWLAALRAEAGLAVPEPVPTTADEWLAKVAVPGLPGPRVCSLLRWVKGRKPRRRFRLHYFRALGRVTAQLHHHAVHWEPPTGFTRRRWNWEGLFGDDAGFNLPARAVWELLPQKYHAPFKTVAEQTRQVMDDWGEGSEAFGLLHADLSIGEDENVLCSTAGRRAPLISTTAATATGCTISPPPWRIGRKPNHGRTSGPRCWRATWRYALCRKRNWRTWTYSWPRGTSPRRFGPSNWRKPTQIFGNTSTSGRNMLRGMWRFTLKDRIRLNEHSIAHPYF